MPKRPAFAPVVEQPGEGIECAHPDCSANPQVKFEFPLPLCAKHFAEVISAASDLSRVLDTKRSHRHEQAVYYLRKGGRIKIGTTSNLRQRLAAIDGGFGMEHMRHVQFQRERIEGEWFQPSRRLLSHIADLRAAKRRPA